MKPAEQLANWVEEKHRGQLIRDTEEPYFMHLVAVAEMAGPATSLGYEIGLCHDLLEDTPVTKDELHEALISFNYAKTDADHITACVAELTDVYTSAAYPYLGKKARKEKEALRLSAISADAQTVKYCDLIYNINWMLHHDRKHAAKYLKRKKHLVTCMAAGDKGLRQKAFDIINNGLLFIRMINDR